MCYIFGLLIQNKNSAINDLLPFMFDFFAVKEKDQIRRKINDKKKFIWKSVLSLFWFAENHYKMDVNILDKKSEKRCCR